MDCLEVCNSYHHGKSHIARHAQLTPTASKKDPYRKEVCQSKAYGVVDNELPTWRATPTPAVAAAWKREVGCRGPLLCLRSWRYDGKGAAWCKSAEGPVFAI